METLFNATMPAEESELISQLLGPYPFSIEQDISSLFWSDQDSYYSSQDLNSSLSYVSQLESNCSSFSPPFDYQACNNYEQMNLVPTNPISNQDYFKEEMSSEDVGDYVIKSSERAVIIDQKPQHKRSFSMDDEVDKPNGDFNKLDIATDNPKKKAKITSKVHRSAEGTKSKKSHTRNANGEETGNNVSKLNVQSSSSCSSEDDSNATQEPKEPADLNLKGREKANHGSSTDLQGLYVKKRRGRINERLRILQNLVPNGTKVDISTTLDEAVQYVKFLQLQIKLLSSDDLWMHAPLAYNGMDIRLHLKISRLQWHGHSASSEDLCGNINAAEAIC